MIPIHELLNRIRWDSALARSRFELAFYDRVQGRLERVALAEVSFPEDERRVFELVDATGQRRRIPFHRVREVYRDGQLIWQRTVPPAQGLG